VVAHGYDAMFFVEWLDVEGEEIETIAFIQKHPTSQMKFYKKSAPMMDGQERRAPDVRGAGMNH